MTSLTERYLAEALRGIPERQRVDVERELRSSIGDAIDDRTTAGEEPAAAERAVLEGLGDPTRLAAGITGRPMYLIGPDLFPNYRRLLTLLLGIIVPITGITIGVIELFSGGTIGTAIVEGGGVAITVAVHLGFWVTLAFALVERADAARQSTEQARSALGRWTLDNLPPLHADRIGLGETVTDLVTNLIGIGFLLVVSGLTWTDPATGQQISIVEPSLVNFWLPFLAVVLFALVGFRVVLHLVGHWTIALAVSHLVIELFFAIPIVWLALNGMLINPAFAAAVGYPPLAEGEGPVMIIVAVSVVLITGWEIIDGFRRALRWNKSGSNVWELATLLPNVRQPVAIATSFEGRQPSIRSSSRSSSRSILRSVSSLI